ncbi:RluA family pseudouridine synthase [Microbaculum sp. FT89]|uniref:RluA family pseudouridine synthase n=1 Tax=Microbaculum sp. FT89 TaxID=3447298 RepID=UPI003F52D56B
MERDDENISVRVPADAAGGRLDRVLADLLPHFSRSRLQALIRDGRVTIGGRTIVEPKYRVNVTEAADTEVAVSVPPPAPATPEPQDIPLEVVYEDDALIVIEKPAGLVVHPGAGTPNGTLVNALLHHCAGSLSGIGGVERPGIVHRLDKDTSGLMVVAKTDTAHRSLAEQFADHGRTGVLERGYRTLVWGVPPRKYGTIDAPIARSPQNPEKMAVRANGRNAVTHYEVVDTFPGANGSPVASLVECRLETGRTHQIRVHMAHIGHPILGDPVYAAGFRSKSRLLTDAQRKSLETLGRQALHAYLLVFAHPVSGETRRFESDFPADLRALVDTLTGT